MFTGADTRWRMMLTCSRALSADSIAEGSEPSPPPCATAMTSSASITPAIGASTIGCSVLTRSRNRRSGHMVYLTVAISFRCRPRRIGAPMQDLLGLRRDARDDVGGRWNIMNQPDSLAGDNGRDVEVAFGPCLHIVGRHAVDPLQQFQLASQPAPGMIVDQAASSERPGQTLLRERSKMMPRTVSPLLAAQ